MIPAQGVGRPPGHVLGMIPAQGMGRPPGHHSPQSPGPAPALIHLKNQLADAPAATPYPMEGVRGPVTFLSPVVAEVPMQLCLISHLDSSGLINFY